jgi:DNA-binding SARP family transcriptional activator
MGTVGCGELKLDLLRSWRLRRDDEILHGATRQQRLIAALAVHGPGMRGYLSGLLWAEYPDARALVSLRVTVNLISRQVPGLLVNGGAMLSLDERVDVDVQRIRSQIQALQEDRHTGNGAAFLHELRDAELLPGWYEDWVVFAQNRLTEERFQALALLARKSLAAGDCETAAEAAHATLEIEPLYERAVSWLVAAELQRENPGAALRAYERYREQLEKDMGLLPSGSLTALVADLLDRQAHPVADRLIAAAGSLLGGRPALNPT